MRTQTAGAFLYVVFYIPLQFVVWVSNPTGRDMSIKKDKKLSKDMVYYICVSFLVVMALFIFVTINLENSTLLFFDSFSACMLGLAAFLQSYMYREYYSVRIIAVVLSIVLWCIVLNMMVFSMSAIGIIILYLMYFVVDILSYISWHRASLPFDHDAVIEIDEKAKKKIIQQKIEEYNKQLKEVRFNSDDDKGINA